ncbi:MAG TPA: glycosyl hydrolase family 18 protein [Symbiobacteriaceae bacterium]|nr:glycosyl hydrolase family 18 protein [Symbiobacteriaceae bacterium]
MLLITTGIVLVLGIFGALFGRKPRVPAPPPPPPTAESDVGGPTTPSALASTGHTDRTVTLTWSASTDDTGVAEYEIYNGLIRIGTSATNAVTLKSLRPSTAYNLNVKARDADWHFSAASNTVTVTTEADTDRTAPSAPAELALLSTTDTRAKLEWAPAQDNSGVTGYNIYNGATQLASAGGSRTTLSNLAPSTTYTITIKARDNAGNLSPASKSITFITGARDTSAPTAPYELVAPEQSDRTAILRWKVPTDNYGVTVYEVYKDQTMIAETTSNNYVVGGLAPGSTATYYVTAKDAAGNRSPASNKLAVTTGTTAYVPPSRTIRAYYAQWATYSGFNVSDIDGSKITHLNYAFADIGDDLKLKVGDPSADVEKAFPGDSASDPYKGNFNQLRKLKQTYPHLKSVISVGGYTWSQKFSDMTLTDARRTAFANSVVDFLVKYGFDGVDFDWEYPVAGGAPGNVRRPIDSRNFTALLQTVRQRLDAQGVKDGKRYELSIAGGASDTYLENTPLAEVAPYLDYVQIMAYDFGGPWEKVTGFNAPLQPAVTKGASVAKIVENYLSKGVPASKLVLGVPFYGYEFRQTKGSNNGLFQPYTGPGISRPYGVVEKDLLGKWGFERHWHAKSQVPYLWNGASFVSYDDPQSMALKAGYVKQKGLAGAMIWEISQDPSEALLQQLYSELR